MFSLPEFSMTKIMTWDFHVNDSAKGIYDMILSRYILTALGLNLKISPHIFEVDCGPFKGSTTLIIQ